MTNEKIHIKCDYCGEIFTNSRAVLDNTESQVASITSQLSINLELPHPTINAVNCQYAVLALQGDFCTKCCIELLETGLKNIKEQIKTGKFKFFS